MKKLILSLLLILFSLPNYICMAEETKKEKKPIVVSREEKFPNLPRTPDFGSDIMAYYQDGVIYLQFVYDMGDVEITVTNESTGEQWQQTEDTAFGSMSITTSTAAGDYFITIVTDDASCYSGSFSI